MSIENRIHYAIDGTKLYGVSGAMVRTEYSSRMSALEVSPINGTAGQSINWAECQHSILLNFPSTIRISKIGLYLTNAYNINMIGYSSADATTDMSTGNWFTTIPQVAITDDQYVEFSVSEMDAKWLGLTFRNTLGNLAEGFGVFYIYIFGEYQTPKFEFYAPSTPSELSGNYPLTFPKAPNITDYAQVKQFRIKNLDSVPHTYTVSAALLRNSTDTILTSGLRLSLDNGSNKYASVTTDTVQSGGISEVITACIDILAVNNNADGLHYFYIDAIEAT